jgi:(2R)-3-sulfolactate dehydrogenase (NADP+)
LGVYAADLAQKGLVSLVFSNGPAVLPPWGGTQKLLSTSPIAAGFPLERGPAIIDLALSTVARGKIAAHAQSGIPLGEGWALDSDGHPTTDPVAALSGMLSPLGGAKGFALAFMVEALTGGIIGPLLSADIPDFFDSDQSGHPQRIAHLVLALDPAITDGTGDAADGARRLADLAERTEAAGGRVPGSRRLAVSTIQPDDQVDVDETLWDQLIERNA